MCLTPLNAPVGLIASYGDLEVAMLQLGILWINVVFMCPMEQEFLVAVGLKGATLQHRMLPTGLSWHEQVRAVTSVMSSDSIYSCECSPW